MLEPSMLAPFVTRTFVQAWLSIWLTPKVAKANRMAFVSRLILYFYYN